MQPVTQTTDNVRTITKGRSMSLVAVLDAPAILRGEVT